MIVLDFKNGEKIVFKDRDEWKDSPYADEPYWSLLTVKTYNPEQVFTRYWVVVTVGEHGIKIESSGTDTYKLWKYDGLVKKGLMNGAWNVGRVNEWLWSAHGAGGSFIEATRYALDAVEGVINGP